MVAAVLQVFDNTPAALDGTLAAGDEITGVNGKPVKGKTKVEVAKMIQAVQVHRCSSQQHHLHSGGFLLTLFQLTVTYLVLLNKHQLMALR